MVVEGTVAVDDVATGSVGAAGLVLAGMGVIELVGDSWLDVGGGESKAGAELWAAGGRGCVKARAAICSFRIFHTFTWGTAVCFCADVVDGPEDEESPWWFTSPLGFGAGVVEGMVAVLADEGGDACAVAGGIRASREPFPEEALDRDGEGAGAARAVEELEAEGDTRDVL